MKTTDPKYYDVTVYKLQSKIKNIIKFDDDDDDDVEYKEYLKLKYTTKFQISKYLNINFYSIKKKFTETVGQPFFIYDYKIIINSVQDNPKTIIEPKKKIIEQFNDEEKDINNYDQLNKLIDVIYSFNI